MAGDALVWWDATVLVPPLPPPGESPDYPSSDRRGMRSSAVQPRWPVVQYVNPQRRSHQ